MSNRKSGSGGRKAKAGKNKQAKGGGGSGGGGGGSPSSPFSNNGLQLPKDEYHNMAIPSCQLLFQLTREMLGLMVDTHNINQTLQPASLLGQMIRKHLNEKRKKQLATANPTTTAGGGASSSTSPNKKKPKKKKKKKKGGNSNIDGSPAGAAATTATVQASGVQQEADETDSTSVIASTVSQDSQQQPAVSAAPAVTDTSSSAAPIRTSTASTATATTTASTTTTADNNMISTTITTTAWSSPSDASPNSNSSSTTPVDLYLDRVQGVIEQKEKVLEDNADSSRSIKGPVIRDIDAFLKYLNTSSATKNSLCITQQELDHASTFIVCPVCRDRVQMALKNISDSKQPVVLPSIPFHASSPPSPSPQNNNNNNNNNNNHNGLAIPIHNQKPNAPPPPAPTVDFDYVAMEEGSSPIGTLLEAKADLEGIPYFHPHLLANTAVETINNNSSSSSNSNNNKAVDASTSVGNNNNNNNSGSGKKQSRKGASFEDSQSKAGTKNNQLEWRFVSCSCGSSAKPPPTSTTGEGTPSTTTITTAAAASSDDPHQASSSFTSSFITLEDLEHIVKDLMIPLATPPDELLGTTPMSDDDLHDIQTRTSRLENDFVNEINIIHGDIQKYQRKFAEVIEMEDSTPNDLAIMSGVRDYIELDNVIYKILLDIVIELMWDKLLWLCGSGHETFVIRHTTDWEGMVAYLTDKSAEVILSMMRAVETYESRLQDDIADNTGKIPELFVSKGHRIVYRTMVETKLRLLTALLQEVRVASENLQDAWPQITGGRVGIGGHHGGLLLSFRRKWFVEQECYRKYAEMQQREENENANAASGNNRRTSTSPGNKGKMDMSSQIHQDQMQQTSSFAVYNGVNQKWFRDLATNGEDLFRGLITLSKHVTTGRLSEQREEHLVRCEKHLGLLQRVGGECVRPVVEKDAKATGYVVKDPNLLNQCANLWTQIQQQSHLPQQQQLLAQNGEGPSIVEQKDTVAQLTVSLLRLLRNLRKHVAENCGPKETPMMPLNAFAGWVNGDMGERYVDLTNVSYDMLVCMHVSTIASCKSPYSSCTGGSAQPRLTALFLALFYKKLSEQCSEWHAELAEQELLITMGESNAEGTNGLSVGASGEQTSKRDGASNRNGVSANATNAAPTKTKNKRRKNKNKEKPAAAESNDGIKETISNETKEDGKDATATETGLESNGVEVEASALGQLQDGAASIEFSTVPVDKDMGVMEPSGAILTAESYLVGRLTSILNGSTTQGSGPVVII